MPCLGEIAPPNRGGRSSAVSRTCRGLAEERLHQEAHCRRGTVRQAWNGLEPSEREWRGRWRRERLVPTPRINEIVRRSTTTVGEPLSSLFSVGPGPSRAG